MRFVMTVFCLFIASLVLLNSVVIMVGCMS